MKKILAMLLCILLLTGCAANYDGPTKTASVMSETVTEHYYAIFGEISHVSRTVYAYDIYGNLAQTIAYQNDEPERKTVYTYDERGNKLTETHYDLTGWFPKRTHHTEFSYDGQNRMISYRYEDTEYTYVFDDEANTCTTLCNGEVREVTVRNEAGQILTKKSTSGDYWRLSEYTYDAEGRTLTHRITESNGNEIWCRYEYDANGSTILVEEVENGIRTETRYAFEYDKQGRRVRRFRVYEVVPVADLCWEYLDENDSFTCYEGGYPSYTVLRDAQGRKIQYTHYYEGTDQIGYRQTIIYRDIQVPAGKEDTP